MNCRRVNSLLSAYMDGELPGVEQIQVRQHLRSCPCCCAEHESLLLTKRLLAGLTTQCPPPDLEARILRRIADDRWTRRAGVDWRGWWSLLAQPQRHRVRIAALCAGLTVAALALAASPFATSSGRHDALLVTQPAQLTAQPPVLLQDYLYAHNPYEYMPPRPTISQAGMTQIDSR